MEDNRPVVIELASGAQYGVKSIAFAREIYPAAKILRYQDGTMIDPDVISESSPAPVDPETGIDLASLAKMPRDQLEKLATDLQIEGADNKTAYPNKGVLAEAVKAAFDAQYEITEEGGEPNPDAPETADGDTDTAAAGEGADSGSGESE